jgi:hypothetical protein
VDAGQVHQYLGRMSVIKGLFLASGRLVHEEISSTGEHLIARACMRQRPRLTQGLKILVRGHVSPFGWSSSVITAMDAFNMATDI